MHTPKRVIFIMMLISLFMLAAVGAAQANGDTTVPVPIAPTCESIGLKSGALIQFSNAAPGVFTAGTFELTIVSTVQGSADQISWRSVEPVSAVLIKNVSTFNRYDYNPAATSGTGLTGTYNATTKKYRFPKEVEFCVPRDVVVELRVKKTAVATWERTWEWDVDKEATTPESSYIPMGGAADATINYRVELTATPSDSYVVTGTIEVFNPGTAPVTVTGVQDILEGNISLQVTCEGISFPYSLAGGQGFTCTYDGELPNLDRRANKALANTSDPKLTGSNAVQIEMPTAPTNEVDECVTFTDDMNPDQGAVFCAADIVLPKIIEYSKTANYPCGSYNVTNTATIVTNDTGTQDSASATVAIDVKCGEGCSLTQGYWSTHSKYGPAPYDDTWAQIGEDSDFFDSGKTWYEAINEPPRGNAYYILASQYIAARLNQLNGADVSAISDELMEAEDLFEALRDSGGGDEVGSDRDRWIYLAGVLDQYNNGVIGPGHCPD